ncbi:hypothetical protein AKJ57_06645, partial [candidate division MSBL1 archaeon SCGC-AAA259A05]
LVSDSRLKGTNLGMKFAVLSVAEFRKTFTLRVKQVGPLKSDVLVVREMLDRAEEILDPRLILLDRGFYAVKVIRELKSRNQGFIMPARKTAPIKKLCEKYEKGEAPCEMEYTVRGKDGEEEVRLVITEEKTKNGTEIHPFITNRKFSAEEVSEDYGWRWRIETNNREFGKFRPFTTSQSMKLRRLYFLIGMLLYDLWIFRRGGGEFPRAYQFKDSLRIDLKVLEFLGEREGRPPPVPVLA